MIHRRGIAANMELLNKPCFVDTGSTVECTLFECVMFPQEQFGRKEGSVGKNSGE